MRRRTSKTCRAQAIEVSLETTLSRRAKECLTPMIVGLIQSKHDPPSFVCKEGEGALKVVLESEAEAVVGPEGKRLDEGELLTARMSRQTIQG
jgi:hypothetical protein